MVYYDQAEFQKAIAAWHRDRRAYAEYEEKRIAELNSQIETKIGIFQGFGFFGFLLSIPTTILIFSYNTLLGYLFLGLTLTGLRIYRFRHRDQFVRREFADPKPRYDPGSAPPPKPDPEPGPPSAERQESHQPRRVTSLRDAFDILGIPISSIEQARSTYRSRMSEYHPDKVAHLGKGLRQLAALKAVEFNIAMDYIASHLPKV